MNTQKIFKENLLLYFMIKNKFLHILYFLEKYVFFTVKLVTVNFMGQRKREKSNSQASRDLFFHLCCLEILKNVFPLTMVSVF